MIYFIGLCVVGYFAIQIAIPLLALITFAIIAVADRFLTFFGVK